MGNRRPAADCAQSLASTDPATGAIVPTLHASTTFARDASYELVGGRVYGRDELPTVEPAERLLTRLEGGAETMLFASGMASATAGCRGPCPPGDRLGPRAGTYLGVRGWVRR